ncbi:MAG TPA: hypothetical protein VHH52_04935 [Pseudonocardiaceae bacterium]|nr:hypothetical protein [Pseudonocardiaceae bacterium]
MPEVRKNVTGELVDRMAGASSASNATKTADVGDQETLPGL